MDDIECSKRIIFALDVANEQEAQKWVKLLEPRISFFKVGLQLFLSSGFKIVDWIIERGHNIMLDLKLYDIPQTVHNAVRQLNNKGISYITVHGDQDIIKAACEAKEDIKVLAVTVLTSMASKELTQMGYNRSVSELVLSRTKAALNAGADGVVASGKEAQMLRASCGYDFILVTPGIRLETTIKNDDQKRIVSPKNAIENGATHLVIGRPIREAFDPIKLIQQIQQEIC